MKKLLSLIVLSLVMMTGLAWAQGSQNFENQTALTTSYADGSFEENEITWTYGHSRDQENYPIDNKGLMLRRASDSYLQTTIPNGIGTFSFQYRKAFTGGNNNNRELELIVNGTQITTTGKFGVSGADNTIHTLSCNVDTAGSVTVKIKIVGTSSDNAQVTIDNIVWTAYTPSGPSIDILTKNLDTFTYVINNGPSTSQTVRVGVENFTSDDVLNVSSSSDYEIKKRDSNVDYGTSVSFNLDGSSQKFYIEVRLKQGLAVGNHPGTLTFSVGSGDDKVEEIMNLTGVVTAPPIDAPVANEATNISHNSFTANWSASDGAIGYLIDVYEKVVGTASDLIISEYVEGSGSNKFIEIYNGTGSTVDLSGYRLQLYSNGASSPTNDVQLSGDLEHDKCLVLKHKDADISDLPEEVCAYENTAVNFNGDDAVALKKNNTNSSVFVDIFGVIGNRPTNAWTGDGGYTTLDKTLVRKAHVTKGITENPTGTGASAFTTLTTEWDMYNKDTVSNLGSHVMNIDHEPSYHHKNKPVGNNLSYNVTGLDADKNYYYVVRAVGSYNQSSANSNEVAVTTLSAPVYDYPKNTQVTLSFGSLTFTDGNANNSSETMPALPNTNIDPSDYQSLALELVGSGHWAIEIVSTVYSDCAYNWQGSWHVVEKNSNKFMITVSKQRGANDLFIVLANDNPTLPVELSSFTVTQNSNGNPVITWETETETGVNGFYIYRGVNKNISDAVLISNLVPATNSSLTHSYSFIDRDLFEDGTYYYWLNVSDLNGHESYHGPAELNYTYVEEETVPEVTYSTALRSIYPNPFNPSANIGFELAEKSEVSISVYNTRGQLVRSFAPFTHGAGKGSIIWDGKDYGGNSASSGIYLFRMKVGAKSYSAKALMMK